MRQSIGTCCEEIHSRQLSPDRIHGLRVFAYRNRLHCSTFAKHNYRTFLLRTEKRNDRSALHEHAILCIRLRHVEHDRQRCSQSANFTQVPSCSTRLCSEKGGQLSSTATLDHHWRTRISTVFRRYPDSWTEGQSKLPPTQCIAHPMMRHSDLSRALVGVEMCEQQHG